MAESWFLWPDARFLRGGPAGFTPTSAASLEDQLMERYVGRGHPVVLSSARAGLVLALESLGVGRPDLVGLFPYASHCVIESVARRGSPVSGPDSAATPFRVVYHQWGYVQTVDGPAKVIEDAVDTFCLSGATLFPAGGDFEVWSFPKLTGSLGGGVLWCREESVAEEVRRRRSDRNALTNARWLLRWCAQAWPSFGPLWYGAESVGGAPPSWGCGDIRQGLQRWDEIAKARRDRLEIVVDLLPSWLTVAPDRLPTAVPVCVSPSDGEALSALGFSAGFRHFEKAGPAGAREMMRVFPIPVHQDVPLGVLRAARRIVVGG